MVVLAPTRRAKCCLSGVWVAKWHSTVVTGCLKGMCRMGGVVCCSGCPPVIQTYETGMAYEAGPRPCSAAANGVCPHVAEFAVAYQGFANSVDHQVGIILCGYKFGVADTVGAVGAYRDMLVVGRIVVGCIHHRGCRNSVVVSLCSILLRWWYWSYPCGGASPNVPKEWYLVLCAVMLFPREGQCRGCC